MEAIRLTEGNPSDGEWLYDLYKMVMMSCIEAAWGWDEEFQFNGFNRHLNPAGWKIIRLNSEKIGGFVLK